MIALRRIPTGDDRAVVELLTTIRASWVNGGAICECFGRVGSGAATAGCVPTDVRTRLRAFLGSEALAAFFAGQRGWWLPDEGLPATPLPEDELIAATAAFSDDLGADTLGGELTGLLRWPGAYDGFGRDGREAARIGSNAAAAVLRNVSAGVTLHRADAGWHPWLHGIHWDRTYVLLDDAGTAVIIAATDSD